MYKGVGNIISKSFLVFYGLCICFSCTSSGASLPIADDKLVDILCDVHIMEGALQNRSNDDKDSIAKMYYQQIYDKHDIKEQQFIETLEKLELDPKKMGSIYGEILIRLDTLEEQSYKSKYKKK